MRFSLSSSPKSQDGSIFTSRMPNAVSYGFTGLSYLRTASDCSHYSCMILFWLPGTSYGKVNISHMIQFCCFWMLVTEAVYRISFSENFLSFLSRKKRKLFGKFNWKNQMKSEKMKDEEKSEVTQKMIGNSIPWHYQRNHFWPEISTITFVKITICLEMQFGMQFGYDEYNS